jgi:hypothetical protein
VTLQDTAAAPDVAPDHATPLRNGRVGRPGAFGRDIARALRKDTRTAVRTAIQRPCGAVGRGSHRC